MWRFLIIAVSTGIYIYIYIYLKRHFKNMKVIGGFSYGENSTGGGRDSMLRKGSVFRKGSAGFRRLSGKCDLSFRRHSLIPFPH